MTPESDGWWAIRAIANVRQGPIRDCLSELALLACVVEQVDGAMVIAVDEDGDAIAAGHTHLEPRSDAPYLVQLDELIGAMARGAPGSGELPAERFQTSSGARRIEWFSLRDDAGYLLLAVDPEAQPRPRPPPLVDVLTIPIRDSLRWEANQRLLRVQQLVGNINVSKEALSAVVHRLADIFDAQGVSLFLRIRDRLRLAATTDCKLLDCAAKANPSALVEYSADDPQLTSYVFRNGALRLKDSLDAPAVGNRTGLHERRGPRLPEHDLDGEILIQFLGVPLGRGDTPAGVLRMSRKSDRVGFTRQDEEALQMFADLLGVVLAEHDQTLVVKHILQSTAESIVVISAAADAGATTIEVANQGAAKVFDLPKHRLEGASIDRLFLPGEMEQAIRGVGSVAGALVRGEIVRPDGSRRTLLGSFWRIENTLVTPSATRILGIASDITELERDRERYIELMSSMGVAYFRSDVPGNTLAPNQVEAAITGYSTQELARMNRAQLFFAPDDRAQLLDKAKAAGGAVGKQVVKWLHKSGRPLWIETDFLVREEPGGSEIVEGVYRDVTRRIQIGAFLNMDAVTALDDAEFQAKLKRDAEDHYEYLSSLGHQLLSPLVALRNNVMRIRDATSARGDELRALERSIRQIGVCIDLVRNMSYMDKVLRGEQLSVSAFDLGEFAIRVKNDFLHLIQDKELSFEIDDRTPENAHTVRGDPALLRQVLVNLTDNAVKYSLPNTTISLRIEREHEATVLSISNQGALIDAEARARLFQRGVRGRHARRLVPHGTGLGLWLVKKILDLHGARIEFNEEPTSGRPRNVFRIRFPGG